MLQLPVVLGLTLCDRMEVDRQARRISLVGLFHRLKFSSFPTSPQQFTVYAAVTDGVGEGVLRLAVTRLETGDTIYRYSRWVAFSADRLSPLHLEIKVRCCVFPAPGRYALELSFDGQSVNDRPLKIVEEIS